MLHHIASAHPFLWVNTFDYERVVDRVSKDVKGKLGRKVFRWDINQGIIDCANGAVIEASSLIPTQPLDFLNGYEDDCVVIALDYHKYIGEIEIWRALLNGLDNYKMTAKSFVVVAASQEMPIEIERYVTLIDYDLPSLEELLAKTQSVIDSLEQTTQYEESFLLELAKSAKGLTEFELENALMLSFSKHGVLRKEFISEQRKQMIKKNGSLEIFESKQGFEAIVGLDRLKMFSKKMIDSKKGRGILLLGVPGTAKSHFAKCLGKETNRPTVVFDVGSLMGSLVGQTEQKTRTALKTIEAQGECVVFIDEIEKAFSGTASTVNDTSVRQTGTILQWMNDRENGSFIIATANNIEKLPPEFLRAERWDAIFFVDLPTKEETAALLDFFSKEYEVEKEDVNIENWTGAEVKSLCRIASSMDIPMSEATQFIQPVAKTAEDKITHLRAWAASKCINASSAPRHDSVRENNTNSRKAVQI